MINAFTVTLINLMHPSSETSKETLKALKVHNNNDPILNTDEVMKEERRQAGVFAVRKLS